MTSANLPVNQPAERAVLAACMARKECVYEAMEAADVDDFYDSAHRAIAEAIWKLAGAGAPVEPMAVHAELKRSKKDDLAGGLSTLLIIASELPDVANVRWYAERVAEASKKRALWMLGQRIWHNAAASDMDADTVLDDAAQSLIELGHRRQSENVTIGKQADTEVREAKLAVEQGRFRKGVESGMAKLDYSTNGWQQGDFIVLAARPSVGKTALALSWALHAARTVPVYFVSLEMTAAALTQRALSMTSRIPLARIRNAALANDDLAALSDARDRLAQRNLTITYAPAVNVQQLLSKARAFQVQHGLGLVIVDYLQIMTSGQRHDNRTVEVTAISGGCKALAGRLSVPIIVLSQLSRPEKGAKPRQHELSDLRDSGAIEQDADVVMFLQRSTAEANNHLAVLRLAKQRQGPLDTIGLSFEAGCTLFREDRYGN